MACPPLKVSDVRLYNMVEIFMFIMVVYLCYTHIISTPSQHQNMFFMTKTFNDCVLLLVCNHMFLVIIPLVMVVTISL